MGGVGGRGGQSFDQAMQRWNMLERNPLTRGLFRVVRNRNGGWSVFRNR